MPFTPELLDELLKDYKKPEDLLGEQGLLQQLTKALVERALTGELTHHLGYEKHDSAGDNTGNSRVRSYPADFFSTRVAMADTRVSGSTGLATCSSKPALRASRRSLSLA